MAADDHLLVGLPLAGPVVTHHAQHSVVALRARAGEEDVVEMGRRDLGQQGRQFGGGGMAGLEEEVVIGQLLHLSGGGIHQLLAAITQVDAPQARHPVQDAAPVGVFQIDPLGLGDDAAALLVQGLKVGEGMQVVAGIQLLPLAGGLLHCLLLGSFDVSDVYSSMSRWLALSRSLLLTGGMLRCLLLGSFDVSDVCSSIAEGGWPTGTVRPRAGAISRPSRASAILL